MDSIRCPDPNHSSNILVLDIDPNAKQLGYCIECITRNHAGLALPKTIRNFGDYLKETSEFYQKCRLKTHNPGTPPVEYLEELSKKAERLEKLSKHIGEEKQKVKKRFEDIRKNVLQVVDLKEKECLQLLENEILDLSRVYGLYEKLIMTGWINSFDIETIYPTSDVLKQRMNGVGSLEQLQAFVNGVSEDKQIENLYDSFERRKPKINHLRNCLGSFEAFIPKLQLQGKLMTAEQDLQGLIQELLKDFSQQEMKVDNSLALKLKESHCGSQVLNGEQFEILKGWLPNSHTLRFKLLYRGSADGMSGPMFHNKCDGKGPTVTLMKCRFESGPACVLGGFIDQNWHSNGGYTHSNGAFLFSMGVGAFPVKCPILESQRGKAFYGNPSHGPCFGGGYDLLILNDFKSGMVNPHSYSDAIGLCYENQKTFAVEEIEVYQV